MSRDRGDLFVIGAGPMGLSMTAALATAGRFDRVAVRGHGAGRPAFLEPFPEVTYGCDASLSPGNGAASAPRAAAPDTCLLFCVPDDALTDAARQWETALGGVPGGAKRAGRRIALHTSGRHAAAALSPLRSAGVRLGVWHPLTALAAPRRDAFAGVTFGVEGDPEALALARDLTSALGGRFREVAPGENARYHAAAVFASNLLVSCMSLALRELRRACSGRPEVEDLLPLARAALDNVAELGLEAGATGPLARGDVGTPESHLRALGPESAEIYRRLSGELLRIVAPRLPPDRERRIRSLLESGCGAARSGTPKGG